MRDGGVGFSLHGSLHGIAAGDLSFSPRRSYLAWVLWCTERRLDMIADAPQLRYPDYPDPRKGDERVPLPRPLQHA